jgi:hypothetical protein
MKIGRNNYEEYILDFLDGKLNPGDHESMRLFLLNNPEIAEEIEAIKESKIPIISPKLIDKKSLYRDFTNITEIKENNFEELCVAYHEGDLDETAKDRLLSYIENDEQKEKLFSLYHDIRFEADMSIRFNAKNSLKKFRIANYRRYIVYSASVAAAILLLIVLYQRQNSTIEPVKIAVNKPDQVNQTYIQKESINEKIVQIKKSDKVRIKKSEQIAAIDTNQKVKTEVLRLATLTPINAGSFKDTVIIISLQPGTKLSSDEEDTSENRDNNILLADVKTQKRNNHKENIFIKALKIGIKGIGDITESNIELSTQTDENGNLTAFALSAGDFEIARTRNKNQKN